MAVQAHDRRCIALEQLETALHLWFDKSNYFSIITLAGAAEEILGKCLQFAGVDTALETIKGAVTSVHRHLSNQEPDSKPIAERANFARNQIKHFSPAQGPVISIDAREEARDMLNRAVDNYWRLEVNLTPAMARFHHEQHVA